MRSMPRRSKPSLGSALGRAFGLCMMASLAACGDEAAETQGAAPISQGEKEALREAARMLDEQALPKGVVPQAPVEDEQTRADNAAPGNQGAR